MVVAAATAAVAGGALHEISTGRLTLAGMLLLHCVSVVLMKKEQGSATGSRSRPLDIQ